MYIGIDIGGTKILVVSSTDGEHVHEHLKIATPPDGETGVETIIATVHQIARGGHITAIGVAWPGPVDTHQQGILTDPVNLHGWHGLNLHQRLVNEFNVPVSIDNDAAAGALGEAHLGAGKHYNHVLYVTWSTGIGTGIVERGKLDHGAYSTEGGHIVIDPSPEAPVCGCGVRGHWEAIIAGPAIKAKFGKEAWELKDPEAWDYIAHWFAVGLANQIVSVSPDVVILGGGVSTHGDMFKAKLDAKLAEQLKHFPVPPVVIAEHIEEAAAYGALILAKHAK